MSPVIIPENLPATDQLQKENIFVMTNRQASHQDIRPLRVLIVNLMPTKITTETQILRLLSNSLIQIELTFLHTASYESKNTPKSHLNAFYHTFDDIADIRFDAMIVTGAPVEKLPFDKVNYWQELTQIFDWAKENVFSQLFICWSAQAALYYYYNVNKIALTEKMFGVFPHQVLNKNSRLTRGFDDIFYAPHSRHTGIDKEELLLVPELDIIAESPVAGPHIITSRNRRQFFIMGHPEYDAETLKIEYLRDIDQASSIQIPVNYFVNDTPDGDIQVKWRSHANLLYGNWLNYFVYQETDYDLTKIQPILAK